MYINITVGNSFQLLSSNTSGKNIIEKLTFGKKIQLINIQINLTYRKF